MKKWAVIVIDIIFLVLGVFCQESEEDIKALLLSKDEYAKNNDITYIARVNMGIPGGENWLVEWYDTNINKSRLLDVYVINNTEIIKKLLVTMNYDVSDETDADIMKDIPGIRIGADGSCAVYDYNGDGFDEVFGYGFWGSMYSISIDGYDPKQDKVVGYCDIPFDIKLNNGTVPVKFTTYKGREGFTAYFFLSFGSPDHPPQNRINKYFALYFYAWDEESRTFAEIEEVDPEYVEGQTIVEPGNSQLVDEPREKVETETHQTVPVPESADKAEPAAENEIVVSEYSAIAVKSSAFPVLWACIGAGVLLLVGVVAAIIIRIRKKRRE